MQTQALGSFEESLADLGVETTACEAAEVEGVLADLVVEPAVGVPLGIEGASLPPAVSVDPTPTECEAAATGVTPVAFGIAEYGTVAIQPTAAGEEPVSLFADTHVAVLAASDLLGDMDEAFGVLSDTFSAGEDDVIFATGPSATADMGELVIGAHGPTAVHVVVVSDR